MKCPMCGGIGLTDLHTPNVGRCIKCNGNGEIEPTNEEWLHSLNTEQLAEWIFNDRVEQSDWWYEQQGHTKAEVIEWLKQPHGGES